MTFLTLASGSAIRATILKNAGVPFETQKPNVDETLIKEEYEAAGKTIDETALALAEAKAGKVAATVGGLVLGSDQILAFDGKGFDKPQTMDDAHARLKLLQGKIHYLVNGIAIFKDGSPVFRLTAKAELEMRKMTDDEIARYLEAAGDVVLTSVGAYQLESLGSRLFSRIEGDYFTILGLTLFPVLDFLRSEALIDF